VIDELVPVAPGVRVVQLRTPTLPPATHTGCYVLGEGRLTVVDPASPWDDEQDRLARALEAAGEVERIVLTHHHVDHVGGAEALRAQLAARGLDVPIVAHPETAARVAGEIAVDLPLVEGDGLGCGGVEVRVLHTPGHAPGHVVLHDAAHGTMVAGDMVAGIGTILIDPSEGDLGDYLASLQRMAACSPSVLLPSHGPALPEARTILGFYVAHRHQRSEQIRRALDRLGASTPDALAAVVYPELAPDVRFVGAVQILAHLRWLDRHGLARDLGDGRYGPP
jgi:glyoxylase-like metal-dependent hydrolase (beta-lactamase superfamily II)